MSSPQTATPAPEYASRAGTPADYSPSQPPHYFSPAKPGPEERQTSDGEDTRDRSQSVNSIASLGSFPSPPTHFPIPPMPSSMALPSTAPKVPDEQDQGPVQASMPPPETVPRISDGNTATFLDFNSPPTSPSTAEYGDSERSPPQSLLAASEHKDKESRVSLSLGSQSDKASVSAVLSNYASTSSAVRASPTYKRGDYTDDAEFGVRKAAQSGSLGRERSPPRASQVERRDTNRSSGSVVSMARGFARSVSAAHYIFLGICLIAERSCRRGQRLPLQRTFHVFRSAYQTLLLVMRALLKYQKLSESPGPPSRIVTDHRLMLKRNPEIRLQLRD